MSRTELSIFFRYDRIVTLADALNKAIRDNRQLNVMIDTIGILKKSLSIEIDNGGDVKEAVIPSGYAFVSISADDNIGKTILEWLKHCDFDLKIVSKELLPIENFLIENEDDEHIFCKRVKSRLITEGHISEIYIKMIGVFQDTCHDMDLVRVDDLINYYLTSDNYMISLADDEKLSDLPEGMAPSFRIHKVGSFIDFVVPRKEYDYVCTECYIKEHLEDWKQIVDNINNIMIKELKESEN